jgi:hypothetical protein
MAIIAAGGATSAWADAILPTTNQGALARSFALPVLGETRVLAPGDYRYRIAVDWTNEYFFDQNANESLVEDGETVRIGFGWRGAVAPGLEMGAQLPVLVTGGGVLDGVIQNWHDFFGLPNGGREHAPHDRYLYRYTRGDSTLLNVDTATTDFGDAELSAGWQLRDGLALRGMVKLPTGSKSDLTGGNAGGAVWVDYDPFRGSRRWFGFVSAGGSVNAKSSTLSDQQHQWLALGGAGLGFRLWQPFSLLGQIYAHSQLYGDSSFKALRRDSVQLALGGRYEFAHGTAFVAGIQEDLVTSSSPDFSIHMDVSFR